MTWLIWTPENYGHAKAIFDHETSSVGSGEFTYNAPFDDSGSAVVRFPGTERQLSSILILPTTLTAIVLRGEAWDFIYRTCKDYIYFRRISVISELGAEVEFLAVKPKLAVSCADVEKSKGIKWVVENRFTNSWSRLAFKENCLENAPIARVELINKLATSDAIKNGLKRIDPSGINFVRPESLPPYI